MKTSLFLAASGAVLAAAGAIEKRKMVTTVEVVWDTVTVTANAEPTSTDFGGLSEPTKEAEPPVVIVTETVDPAPAPEPTTSSTQQTVDSEPYPTTQQPEPTITSSFETIPMPTTTVKPEPEPEPTTTTQKPSTTKEEVEQPTQPAQPGSDDMPGQAIYHHNYHRSNHSAPEMQWNDEITGYAANSAASCVFEHDMDQGSGGYGQNLAMWAVSDGAEALGEAGAIKMAITDMWYNGEFNSFLPSYYGMSTPDMSNFEAWGHFTQVVWADSTDLGCAVKLCPSGTMVDGMDAWFMVCNYAPAGNMGSAYASNVMQPAGMATMQV